MAIRDRDINSGWTGASDGTREERAYYAQNWRGDVSAVFDHAGEVQEWDKYRAYGVPYLLTPGDHNKDGVINSSDSDAFDEDYDDGVISRADLDKDGDVDADDEDIFVASYAKATAGGRWKLSASGLANRKGCAGYEHDGYIPELAHVRHRVLHFGLGRWTRRDPLGYVDGKSLLQYARSAPIDLHDPSGLKCYDCRGGEPFTDPWQDLINTPTPEKTCPIYRKCNGRLLQVVRPPSPATGHCGSEGDLVPENPFGFSFNPCCGEHDTCYSTCNSDDGLRTECDNRLCTCVHDRCAGFNGVRRLFCDALAMTYCAAVRTLGRSFFCAAQSEFCACKE